jgi:hypothetical protein
MSHLEHIKPFEPSEMFGGYVHYYDPETKRTWYRQLTGQQMLYRRREGEDLAKNLTTTTMPPIKIDKGTVTRPGDYDEVFNPPPAKTATVSPHREPSPDPNRLGPDWLPRQVTLSKENICDDH